MTKKVIDFNRLPKQEYMKPTMNVVRIQQQHIICTSPDANGMNSKLQSEEVGSAWSRGSNGWDDDEE